MREKEAGKIRAHTHAHEHTHTKHAETNTFTFLRVRSRRKGLMRDQHMPMMVGGLMMIILRRIWG